MNKILALFLLTASICLLAAGQVSPLHPRAPRIIPTPQQITPTGESFKLTSQTRIILGERSTAGDRFAAQQINGWLAEQQKAPLRVTNEGSTRKVPKNIIFLGSPLSPFGKRWLKAKKISLGHQLKEEGYVLESNQDEIVILGESECGRFYGTMTLLQLFSQQQKSIFVPGAVIADWPQQTMRHYR